MKGSDESAHAEAAIGSASLPGADSLAMGFIPAVQAQASCSSIWCVWSYCRADHRRGCGQRRDGQPRVAGKIGRHL